MLSEFNRVCRPGGVLYLTVPFMQPEHLDPTDYQRYTLPGLERLVRQHGFEVTDSGGVHSVYTTLAWIVREWLAPKQGRRRGARCAAPSTPICAASAAPPMSTCTRSHRRTV